MRVADGETKTFDSWPAFYHDIYDPIWHDVEKSNVLSNKCRKQIAKIHEKLDRLLVHADQPRLVHWDIWSTNIMAHQNSDGRWRVVALLDPNCKFAHCEAEIAYMEMFHTITPAFMKAYQQHGHMHNDYHRIRKHIYQLYPLINHVHLFGQEYAAPLQAALDRVSNVV